MKKLDRDSVIVGLMILVIVGVVLYGIWYTIFYWQNCAFTEAAKAPALCYQGRK